MYKVVPILYTLMGSFTIKKEGKGKAALFFALFNKNKELSLSVLHKETETNSVV